MNNSVALEQLAVRKQTSDSNINELKKGLYELEKSAALGNTNAMKSLAMWKYQSKSDIEGAVALYKKAAQLGQQEAMNALAIVLPEPENYTWALKAYENGSEDLNVLMMAQHAYQYDIGVQKNVKIAENIQLFIQTREKRIAEKAS